MGWVQYAAIVDTSQPGLPVRGEGICYPRAIAQLSHLVVNTVQ